MTNPAARSLPVFFYYWAAGSGLRCLLSDVSVLAARGHRRLRK
jgi:hypothetical protein